MARQYGNWNESLGNNFTDNGEMPKDMMTVKNWQTQGGYQAEVSGAYGEFTVATVFKALPDCYAVLNDILIQTGVQYRRYSQKELSKYGVTPWQLGVRTAKGVQIIDKNQALNIINSNPGASYYEIVKMSSQLDHVIVSPYGIFVIETKNHKGMIWGDMYGKVWTETFLSSHHTFYNPVAQNEQHLKFLSKSTGIKREFMTGIIVFTNPQADLSNVQCPICVTVPQLAQTIAMYTNSIWSEQQTDKVIKQIEKVNSSSYSLSKEHVTYVKDLQHRQEVNKQYKKLRGAL